MSNILNCLVHFGFNLFGCNIRQREKNTVCVKGIITTSILKHGAQFFNEDCQPILIELADMSVALKGGDRRKRRKLEEKEGFDTDAYSPSSSSSSSSSITSYTCTLREDDPSRLLQPTCSGQCDFEDGWVFTHSPTSIHTYPYRPVGPELGPAPMDISD
jgi:hypothetical protein